MGSLLWLALALAIAGAVLNGLGALWQNTAVRDNQTGKLVSIAALVHLLRNRRWLMGQLAVIIGSALHFGALAFAPVTVIQPIGVLGIAVTTVASAKLDRAQLSLGTWLSLAAIVLGVGGFTSLAASNAQVTRVSDETAVLIAMIVGLLLMLLGLIGSIGHGLVRCLAFAAGGGVVFGFASVVIRLAALSLEHGNPTDFPTGSLIGAILSIPVAVWFIQQAHASGPPDLVVAALTLADPIVAIGIGYVALGEGAKTSTVATLAEGVCFLIAAIGIVVLPRMRRKSTSKVSSNLQAQYSES
ncbi:DMT family transporter [Kibdelosporangium aridum]|uniref:Magnesium transporter NIPA n=1 Tax=Kibdelosporangium aridum TaxID=2030 RepID=A0A1Y5XGF4_KIBAR|nr:DMT family transporter [Kibdelosporangium aridum]SMC92274.1 Magnesium transporter NIPA [Kibdelosporangium aridum]